ncbi:hypothetical protein SAY86_027234 [Trapa natans]|uniref:Uncharacterized protein n=1 Tax=Trapa natans TaxID=22666 RepID=A0AAN7QIV9_TRANT|nr:hypothetical protein SAY86_027234 [Trapa natans]
MVWPTEASSSLSSSSSSPGNSPQFYREKIVYLDDVEKVQSPLRPNMNCQDRRLFKFKHSPSPLIQKPDQEGHSEGSLSWEDQKSPVRKSKRGPEKRARRRSPFRDDRCTKSRPNMLSDDASSRSILYILRARSALLASAYETQITGKKEGTVQYLRSTKVEVAE